jgi:hypothetical protein
VPLQTPRAPLRQTEIAGPCYSPYPPFPIRPLRRAPSWAPHRKKDLFARDISSRGTFYLYILFVGQSQQRSPAASTKRRLKSEVPRSSLAHDHRLDSWIAPDHFSRARHPGQLPHDPAHQTRPADAPLGHHAADDAAVIGAAPVDATRITSPLHGDTAGHNRQTGHFT